MKKLQITYEPTGEYRPPRAGEWFRDQNGVHGGTGAAEQALFDFHATSFEILREIITEGKEPT